MTDRKEDTQRRRFLAGAGLVAGAAAAPAIAQAPAQFRWKLQSANPAGTPHMTLLNKFASNVDKMSNGRLKIEVLTSGAIVNPFEILDAVNKGVVDSGQWWTHYATGKHPAGGLFSAPLGGSGSGLDQMGQLGWYFRGGGPEPVSRVLHEDPESRRDAVSVRAGRTRMLRLVQEAGHVGC